MSVTRRRLLAGTGAVGAGIAFTGALSELFAGDAAAAPQRPRGLRPARPRPRRPARSAQGFRYKVLSREGDPLRSGEGPSPATTTAWPPSPAASGRVHLVRNHENRVTTPRSRVPTVEGLTYDPAGKGGCTALELDRRNNVLAERVAHRRHGRQLRGRAHPVGHLADLRGDRGQGRHQRLHQGPRLHLRGRRRRPAPHRRRAADRDGPLPARGDRRRPAARASSTRPRTPSRSRSASSTASCPKKPLGGTGSLRAGGELQAMRVPGVPRPVRRSRRPARPSTASSGSTSPTRWPKETADPLPGLRPEGHHARPEAGGLLLGRRAASTSSPASRSSAEGSAADHFGQIWRYDPQRAPAHPGDRLRPRHRHPAARRVAGQHLPRAQRRPDGVRGRRRRPARLRA